jgi:hypothetical protein
VLCLVCARLIGFDFRWCWSGNDSNIKAKPTPNRVCDDVLALM